jgi:simple sugar transport system permease protein
VAAAAGLFGYADALRLRPGNSVHALILFAGILMAVAAVVLMLRRRQQSAVIMLAVAGGVFLWYALTSGVPDQFVSFTPHLVTLIVLSFASQRLRPPAADGKPYRKGQAT